MDYLARLRVRRAKALLRNGRLPVTRIAFDLGFSSSQYFATFFKRFAGFTPTAYRLGMAAKRGR